MTLPDAKLDASVGPADSPAMAQRDPNLPDAPTTPRRRRTVTLWAIVFISLGLFYRGYLTFILPVGYDEVKVVVVGLEEMRESPGKALIEVPIRRSSAMTPLWWWIQYSCTAGGRAISLLTIRIAPVLLGVMTLLVGYRVCAARWGRSTGVVFAAWLALSDVLTFTNSRGDFAESLMVCLLVPLVPLPCILWYCCIHAFYSLHVPLFVVSKRTLNCG